MSDCSISSAISAVFFPAWHFVVVVYVEYLLRFLLLAGILQFCHHFALETWLGLCTSRSCPAPGSHLAGMQDVCLTYA